MILFETDKKPLTFLLDQITHGEVALPDFQRSFVWDANATRELVSSIFQSFPAGTILLMRGGGKVFAPRAVEESPDLGTKIPSYLVLDGQQRLTSLYQAFNGGGTHRFFLNIQELIDGEDIDEATEVFTVSRSKRWDAIERQAEALMLPLTAARAFSDWRDDVLELREEEGEDRRQLRRLLNKIEADVVKAIETYHFPVTTLAEDTPIEAVCTIFETLNKTGVKLSVFELLTARAFAHDVRLRELWETAKDEHPILEEFALDPYYLLQAIAVRTRGSAKRKAVLSLAIPEVADEWDRVVRGMSEGLRLVRDECGVLVEKWLPYKTMLVTIAATWPLIDDAKGPATGERRGKLKQWFWCSVFSGAYDNASNSQAESDTIALRDWLGGGQSPAAVRDFTFDPARWRGITSRQRALYQSTMALLLSAGPLDFHEASKLGAQIINGHLVDDHHIFPRAWLKEHGYDEWADTVLNHTLIDKITNIIIGGHAPSHYLAVMSESLKDELPSILESHGLPSSEDGPLFQDRFEDFLDWRIEYLAHLLSQATGTPVVVGPDQTG